ncbi:MAG: hypothetical protein JWQ71_2395 [Pedosphaera sp.]|nr:hypothetical protein [Pedosphaera sp.]
MKKLHAVLLLLGVAFLTWLVRKIGVREIWHELASLGWGLIPLILCEGVAELIHTVGWRHCLNGPLRSLPLTLLFRIRMAGYAINYVTPTAMLGGEVTKAALLASHHEGPEAVSGVLIEKLCFAFSHLLFVALGSLVIVWRIQLPRPLWMAMLFSSALVGAGILAFLLLQNYGKLGVLVRWLATRNIGGRVLQQAAGKITEVDEALKVYYRKQRLALVFAICWHLLGFSVGIFQTWLFFHLLHQNTLLAVAAGTWFLGMWFDLLTFAVPMNLGSLEGSRILALKAIGYDTLLGMTYGLALRLALLFWAGFGLVSYALLASRSKGLSSKASAKPHRTDCRRTR